jgi:hypothetical protein
MSDKVKISAFVAAHAKQTTSIVSSEKPAWRDPDCGQPIMLTKPGTKYGIVIKSRNERRLQRKKKRKKLK